MKADSEHEAGEAVTQSAKVTQFGQIVNPPERLMMNVTVSAVVIQHLSAIAELDSDEIKAESEELAFVGAGI